MFDRKEWARKVGFQRGHKFFLGGEKGWFKKGDKPPSTCFKKNDTRVVGEGHPSWKGSAVKYRGLHAWVARWLGKPNKCSECGKVGYGRQMHWANKSGEYKRDLSDWLRLCVSCHRSYDLKRR